MRRHKQHTLALVRKQSRLDVILGTNVGAHSNDNQVCLTPASEVDLVLSSTASCLLYGILHLPAGLPSTKIASLATSHPLADLALGVVPQTYPATPLLSLVHI